MFNSITCRQRFFARRLELLRTRGLQCLTARAGVQEIVR